METKHFGAFRKKTIVERESNFLQAITFHYAEIHDSSERIFSSQKLPRTTYILLTPSLKMLP